VTKYLFTFLCFSQLSNATSAEHPRKLRKLNSEEIKISKLEKISTKEEESITEEEQNTPTEKKSHLNYNQNIAININFNFILEQLKKKLGADKFHDDAMYIENEISTHPHFFKADLLAFAKSKNKNAKRGHSRAFEKKIQKRELTTYFAYQNNRRSHRLFFCIHFKNDSLPYVLSKTGKVYQLKEKEYEGLTIHWNN